MSDPHELGRELSDLVPDPPAVPGRTSSVLARARRNRRRRTGLVAAGAAVAVAAVTLTVAGLGSSGPTAGPSAPTSTSSRSPTVEPVTDVECPTPYRRGQDYVDPTSTGPLPEGAVVARACPTNTSFGFAPPADALVVGVDRLERTLQELPPLDNGGVCTSDLGLSYWLVLGYPDGTERVVEGHNYGCHDLRGAGEPRGHPERLWTEYLRLLREQRASSTPPGGTAVDCPGPGTNFPRTSPMATSLDVEHAVLRWRRTDTESTSTWQCAPVPDDDVRAITADLADGPSLEIEEEACQEATLQLQLVGVNAWGDVGTTWSDCGYWSVDGSGTYRVLGSGAQSAVDRIVTAGGAPPLPEATPRTGPDEVVLLFTDLLNDGRRDEALALTNDPAIAEVDGRSRRQGRGRQRACRSRARSARLVRWR